MDKKKSSQKENSDHVPDVKKEIVNLCMVCGNKATGCFSFDIDLPKFAYCEKDKFSVFMYLAMVTKGDIKAAKSFLSFAKELPDVKSKKNTKATSKKRKRNSKGE